MKYLFIPILFLSFLLITNKSKNPKNTNVILKISNLKEEDIQKNLINEFRRKSDIDYIDGSVLTKTVVLQVNERKFNKSEIEKYMQRWGLDIDEYVFTNNTSISDIEN
ncbi:MAG: hypothetical protein CMG14_01000 [Candidatus Marinimicrobia bacterium]|nr:hypothetical protein [Candidatus Neomarinimicrobiota bacterium]|tara:strand:+ start:12 stop:335 length:324 start_codon:yes stop_codon:yes gene_type:complete